jgi:hypothetical protein
MLKKHNTNKITLFIYRHEHTHTHCPECVIRGSVCDCINNVYISIMMVTSIHADLIAQNQDFLKWLILDMETDGECDRK